MIISICPFLLDVPLYVLHQLMHKCRDQGGKSSGARVYYPPLRFLQSTLDDSGHNQCGPMPMLRAMWLQSATTQGCQKLSHTENDARVAVAHVAIPSVTPNKMHMALTKRHSSPVEVVLTGSRVALLGLIEILRGSCWGHGTINKG